MDHIRTVKPSFFTDEQMGARPPLERLLFVSLWCQADREGRLEDRPGRIKVKALPYDECDVDAMLGELERAGFIRRYESADRRYIQVIAFGKHQRPNSREPASEIPSPQSVADRTRMHAHAQGEGKGTEGNGKGREGVSSAGADVQAVFDHWRSVHGHPDAKLTPKRSAAVRGRLRDGYSAEQLKGAIEGCKASAFHQGDNEQRKVYDELTLICRDGEHVEQFIGHVNGSQRSRSEKAAALGMAESDAAAQWIKEHGGMDSVAEKIRALCGDSLDRKALDAAYNAVGAPHLARILVGRYV